MDSDVVVVGGGVAGVAAAVTAAREGAKCVLIEKYGFPGGLAVSAEVGTFCGFFSTGNGLSGLAGKLPEEILTRYNELSPIEKILHPTGLCYLPYQPVVFERILSSLLEEAGVECLYHSIATSMDFESCSLTALVENRLISIESSAWVDASGEATLSLLAELPVIEEVQYQAPGYVFRCNNVEIEALAFSESSSFEQQIGLGMMRAVVSAKKEGKLQDIGGVSVVPGSICSGSLSIKLAFPFSRTSEFNESTRIEKFGRKACFEIFEILKKNCEGFEIASLSHIASQAGIRSGVRGKGKSILGEENVLGAVKSEQVVANGLWPVEYWDGGLKPELEFGPKDDYFQIPLGAIHSSEQENLFFAGRCLSADSRAHSAARVIGTSLATGAAAGRIAALTSGGCSLDESLEIHQQKEGFLERRGLVNG